MTIDELIVALEEKKAELLTGGLRCVFRDKEVFTEIGVLWLGTDAHGHYVLVLDAQKGEAVPFPAGADIYTLEDEIASLKHELSLEDGTFQDECTRREKK